MSPAKRARSLVWNVPVGLQLSAIYALLLAAVLALLGFALYAQLDSFLIQNTRERLERTTRTSLEQLFPPRDRRPPRSVDMVAGSLVRGLSSADVAVAVLDRQGNSISAGQSGPGNEPLYIPPLTADWPDRIANGAITQWVSYAPTGERVLVVLTPLTLITTREDMGLLLQQVASLEGADAVLNQLRLYVVLGILIGTVAGVLAGLALTRVVLRPLDRISRTAEAISAGDLDRRIRLPAGRNEVARLGHAFDSMVERLASALEAQRRFVADASHELRTPLTSLEGLSEMLLIGADRGDTRVVQRTVRSMHGELRRLGRLVADLLTLSRLDSTAPTISFKPVSPCPLLAGLVEQMTPVAEAKEVRLSLRCEASVETALLRADPDRLKQVLLNLLDNALRYTPEQGEVRVRASTDATGRRLLIEVQDTGQGITPEDLPHVFDRFYRGDLSRARATGNTGLGLSIARAIVERHGGSISVQSSPGEGATFSIVLPMTRAQTAPEPEAALAESR
ncbi:MAG TPA: ATP-binding protein [Chloroflexia bacterium]|jgi:two-component system OmpR family sensor kinase